MPCPPPFGLWRPSLSTSRRLHARSARTSGIDVWVGVQIQALSFQAIGCPRVSPAMANDGMELNSSQQEMAASLHQGPASLSRLASPSASAAPKARSLTEYFAEVLRKVELMQLAPLSTCAHGKTRSWMGMPPLSLCLPQLLASILGLSFQQGLSKPLRPQTACCSPRRNSNALPQ